MAEANLAGNEEALTALTANQVLLQLRERVSNYNAQLLLDSALVGAGFHGNKDSCLNVGEAKTLCLELIRQGGPAFQVGQALYRQFLQ